MSLYKASSKINTYYSDDEAYVLKEIDGILYLCEDVSFYNNKNTALEIIGQAFQNTGIKDKLNKDIYVGDTLKLIGWNKGWDNGLPDDEIRTVVFDEGFMLQGEYGICDILMMSPEYTEII